MTLHAETPAPNFAAPEAKIVRLNQERDLSHLPPPETKRWVVSRKAIVVDAVRKNLLTLQDACARYNLSEEEIRSWMKLAERGGSRALRVTRLQDYRRKPKVDGKLVEGGTASA